MTAAEMLVRFEQKIKNFDIKNIDIQRLTSDISYYLTESQRRIVEQYYSSYETSEKARKVLAPLITNVDLTRTSVSGTQTGAHPNGELWSLPSEVMYTLKEECTVNLDECGDTTNIPANQERVYTKPINIDYYNKHHMSPFKKPYAFLVWRLDLSNGQTGNIHELITAGAQIQKYHLTYLKYPTAISIESNTASELHELVHQDIVDGAVGIALEAVTINNQLNTNR